MMAQSLLSWASDEDRGDDTEMSMVRRWRVYVNRDKRLSEMTCT